MQCYSTNVHDTKRSAKFLSTSEYNLKNELFDTAYSKCKHTAYFLPLCAYDLFMTYGAV